LAEQVVELGLRVWIINGVDGLSVELENGVDRIARIDQL